MAQTDARQRIVTGAADMISRRGLAATSVRELAKHADAPLGSTYHYFPGGKQQLATEAVRHAGAAVSGVLCKSLKTGPAQGLRAFLKLWRTSVLDSDFHAGCPVLAVAVEEPTEAMAEPIAAAAEVFTEWQELLATSLREHGVAEVPASQLATMIVAAVEGTVAMCRAKRDITPLDQVADQLETMINVAATGDTPA
jgi:AcrR family transcriptional regulator